MTDVQRDIGELDGRMGAVESRLDRFDEKLDRQNEKLDKLMEHVSAQRGGWRMLAVVGSVAGALGAGLVEFFRGAP